MDRVGTNRFAARAFCLSLLLCLMLPVVAAEPAKIGVLAHRGDERTLQSWTPTAEYLSQRIPTHEFEIVPLTNDSIAASVAKGEIDFVLTNPASYAGLEARFGVSRIATIRNLRAKGAYTKFGAVIFTRADRDDIRSLTDLEGKTFMAVHPEAFGGWWMAWREFHSVGMEPTAFKSLQFSGFPQDKIVFAVRDGRIDAGTVRTDLLESMHASGLINQSQFKVLNAQHSEEFPFRHSTRLYPEWPIAMAPHTSRGLAQKVAVALLDMDPESPAAKAANIAGWTVPLDYQAVHELMRELKVGPYVNYGKVTVKQVLQQYWLVISIGLGILALMTAAAFYVIHLNRSLRLSKTNLEREIEDRKRAENKSAQLGRLLDESSNEIFVFDCDTLKYIQVNKGACLHLGYTCSEMLGLTPLDLHPDLNPDHLEKILQPLRDGGEQRIVFETTPQCKNGSRYTANVWLQILRMDDKPVFVAVYEDITARKRAEQALMHEKERAKVTLMSIGDAVITTDKHGIIEYFNPVAEQMTGYSNHHVIGNHLRDVIQLIDARSQQALPDPVGRCLQGGRFIEQNDHVLLSGKNARQSPVHQTVTPRRSWNGEIEGVVIVYRDVTELQRLQQEMKFHATHDDLTKLVNRRELQQQLTEVLAERNSPRKNILLFIDLDQFKIINDSCGHAAGDKLLKEMAALLQDAVRSSDTVARLGGDEFAILLRALNDIGQAEAIARQIITSVNALQFFWFEKLFHIGVSIGILLLDEDMQSCSDALAMADSACYAAKDKGRNQYYIYSNDDETLLRRRVESNWIHKIKHALEHNKFLLYCQPIMNLSNGHRVPDHVEMLLRLSHDGEIFPPASFIPAAERYQQMPRVDHWVVENTFRFLANPGNTLDPATKVSINISGQTLVNLSFVDFVTEKLEQFAIVPQRIIFEITETAAIANFASAIQIIERLKSIGCRFSLDDFGSGMSSLSYLKNLPVDFLKIDGSFIKGIADRYDDYVMVQAITQIGKLLNVKTIAEFADSQEIIDKLVELQIELAQGFALGEPVPARSYISVDLVSVG